MTCLLVLKRHIDIGYTMNTLLRQTFLDKTAIFISALCIIHCSVLPILMLGLPVVWFGPLQEEGFHLFLVTIVLPISLLGIISGCRKHKNYQIVYLGVSGLVLLVLTGIYGHDVVGDFGEKFLTVIASGILITVHILNFSHCKQACCD